jgi:hypothetical protein
MAQIILQATAYNQKYSITPLVIDKDTYNQSKRVAIEVIPDDGYIVNAANFYSGFLSPNIFDVTYSNTNEDLDFENRVRITATLKDGLLEENGENVIITIPLNGYAEIPSNKLEFTDITTHGDNFEVINKTGSVEKTFSRVINSVHTDKYLISGRRNEAGIIMEKTFIADQGYYFKTLPTWSMNSSRKNNFIIKSRETRDDKNRVVEKVYTISYRFPDKKTMTESLDEITFSASVTKIKTRITSTTPDKKEEHKIYSISVLPSGNAKNSNQYFIVKGVPGSEFNILAQDQDKNIYDFETGKFGEGGKMLTGVIPRGKNGRTGIYRGVLKKGTQSKVDIRMITSDVNTEELVDKGGAKVISQKVSTAYTASIIADKTSITGLQIGTATVTSDKILETGVVTVPFSYLIRPAEDKLLVLKKEHAGAVSEENLIEMDFDITSGKKSDTKRGATFTLDTIITPVGEPLNPHDALIALGIYGYAAYNITGEMHITDIGEENLVVEMMLNNFFSEHDPA